jgi:predicted aspartyl protease
MEVKKKAEELVKKFALGGWSKEHAINCVDEIIDTAMTGYLVNDRKVAEFQIKMRDYWKQVKTEIEALP